MDRTKTAIPYYTDINEFLASIPWAGRTSNPDFYCLRLQKPERPVQVYRPPFKRSFYFLALLINSGKARISYDDQTVQDPEAYLVFHSPGLVYSFAHSSDLEGYLVYFKPECFSFFKPGFHQSFPLFDPLRTNLFRFDTATFNKLTTRFEEVFTAYERSDREQHMEARARLLALLYHLKDFALEQEEETRWVPPQQQLVRKFVELINAHYIDKRTVQEYADLLAVTPNYLSQSVKATSGKNALTYIAERILQEAKSLIRYTDFEMAEIAYQLNFSDPANFGKFFKKQAGMSPSAFRKLGKD